MYRTRRALTNPGRICSELIQNHRGAFALRGGAVCQNGATWKVAVAAAPPASGDFLDQGRYRDRGLDRLADLLAGNFGRRDFANERADDAGLRTGDQHRCASRCACEWLRVRAPPHRRALRANRPRWRAPPASDAASASGGTHLGTIALRMTSKHG